MTKKEKSKKEIRYFIFPFLILCPILRMNPYTKTFERTRSKTLQQIIKLQFSNFKKTKHQKVKPNPNLAKVDFKFLKF